MEKKFKILPFHRKVLINEARPYRLFVTLLRSNHSPGSCMFIFERHCLKTGDIQRYFHSGHCKLNYLQLKERERDASHKKDLMFLYSLQGKTVHRWSPFFFFFL